MDDNPPRMVWTRWHWAALAIGGILWIPLWYGIGALIYFILNLK